MTPTSNLYRNSPCPPGFMHKPKASVQVFLHWVTAWNSKVGAPLFTSAKTQQILRAKTKRVFNKTGLEMRFKNVELSHHKSVCLPFFIQRHDECLSCGYDMGEVRKRLPQAITQPNQPVFSGQLADSQSFEILSLAKETTKRREKSRPRRQHFDIQCLKWGYRTSTFSE